MISRRLLPYHVIGENDYFGEADLLLRASCRHSATAVSKGVCELFAVLKADLRELLGRYPEVRADVMQLARQRQHYYLEL
jgi:CRP-like cAMP-binding protein